MNNITINQSVNRIYFMNKIYSIGYSGLSITQFVTILQHSEIDMVVDVRLSPYSRIPYYRKKDLSGILTRADIKYHHLPQWGNQNYRGTHGHNNTVLSSFEEGAKVFDQLRNENDKIAVMCMCSTHGACHRSDALSHYQKNWSMCDPFDLVLLRQENTISASPSLEATHIQESLT